MSQGSAAWAWAVAALFGLAAFVCVPIAMEAGALLAIADDPVAIADRALVRSFDQTVAQREIEAALAANDADLAKSFLDLAVERNVPVPPELAERVMSATERANSTAVSIENFARGFVAGEPDEPASFVGATLGDLFVFGDVRDVVREGSRYVSGEKVDDLVLGLACAGIVITAGTYATLGVGAPARVGLSMVKVARKTGQMGARMADWLGRTSRDVVDLTALRRAAGSLAEPAVALRAVRDVVKTEPASNLVRLVSDVGRVQAQAGTKAALDGLKTAETPRELSRIVKLSEKKGSKTRAILKVLGRGAIWLAIGSFNLAVWIIGALITLFGFAASAKSGVERATRRRFTRLRERQRCAALVPAAAQA